MGINSINGQQVSVQKKTAYVNGDFINDPSGKLSLFQNSGLDKTGSGLAYYAKKKAAYAKKEAELMATFTQKPETGLAHSAKFKKESAAKVSSIEAILLGNTKETPIQKFDIQQ